MHYELYEERTAELQATGQSNLCFEGVGVHRRIILIEGAARVVGTRQGDRPLAGQVHFHDGIDH